MSDQPVSKRTFDYAAFIEELSPLVARAKNLKADERWPNSYVFRQWQIEVNHLLKGIRALGYEPTIGFGSRTFGIGADSQDDVQYVFTRDIGDVIIEFDLLIGTFQKYGDSLSHTKQSPSFVPSEIGAKAAIA
jgi:hypothetical protein